MYKTLVSALALVAICAPAQATEATAMTDISAAQRRSFSVSRAPVIRSAPRVQRSVSRRVVTDTLYVKDEPADVVFAGGKAFVSASRNNQIAVFDLTTHALLTNITVQAGSLEKTVTDSADAVNGADAVLLA